MWQYIEQTISNDTGRAFNIDEKHTVSGGDINLCYQLIDNRRHQKYFVKINDKTQLANFEAEAYSLNHIAKEESLSCPDVVTLGTTLDKSFLVLEYLPLITGTSSHWFTLGEQLAYLHKTSVHGQFGWPHENFIGLNIQQNAWSSNWRTFFTEQRIGWQLQLLHEKSINLGDITHICEHCHQLLLHHNATPSLVHGDLWRGNIGFTKAGPIVFDPASYYADREVDIAMTELFGRFPIEFYQGYQSIEPLSDGYEQRKLVYNFYHILNHANAFAGIYLEQAKATLSRIMALSAVHG